MLGNGITVKINETAEILKTWLDETPDTAVVKDLIREVIYTRRGNHWYSDFDANIHKASTPELVKHLLDKLLIVADGALIAHELRLRRILTEEPPAIVTPHRGKLTAPKRQGGVGTKRTQNPAPTTTPQRQETL